MVGWAELHWCNPYVVRKAPSVSIYTILPVMATSIYPASHYEGGSSRMYPGTERNGGAYYLMIIVEKIGA